MPLAIAFLFRVYSFVRLYSSFFLRDLKRKLLFARSILFYLENPFILPKQMPIIWNASEIILSELLAKL